MRGITNKQQKHENETRRRAERESFHEEAPSNKPLAPITMLSTATNNGTKESGSVEEEKPRLGVATAEGEICDAGVASPFEYETLPSSAEDIAQTFRIPLTTSFGSVTAVSRAHCWLVCWKQSTHCGKADWKVSVHAHLITSTNPPGLNRIVEKLARTDDASAQLLMVL